MRLLKNEGTPAAPMPKRSRPEGSAFPVHMPVIYTRSVRCDGGGGSFAVRYRSQLTPAEQLGDETSRG